MERFQEREKINLLNNSKISFGIITSKSKPAYNRGAGVRYKYFVDNNVYESGFEEVNMECLNSLKTGDTITIRYAKKKYNISEFLESYWRN